MRNQLDWDTLIVDQNSGKCWLQETLIVLIRIDFVHDPQNEVTLPGECA